MVLCSQRATELQKGGRLPFLGFLLQFNLAQTNEGAHLSSKTPHEQFGKEVQSLHCHSARGLNFSGDEPPHQPTNLPDLNSKKGFSLVFCPRLEGKLCSLNPFQFESVSASKNRKDSKNPCQGESKMSKEQVYHAMCDDGYVGDDCSKCAESHGKADYNPLTCLKCPTSPWRSYSQGQNFQAS